jgi:hypothetical protein
MSDQEMLSCEGDISPIFQSNSSSSVELNSIDNGNGSQKKVTLNALNEKLSSLWEFLQRKETKQKKQKLKLNETLSQTLENQNELKLTISQTLENQNELKESISQTMEKHDELKKTVFDALEIQNGNLAQTLSKNSQMMSSVLENQSRKIHETFDVQTKSVNAAIEQHSNKIEEVIEDQRNYLQQNLQMLREENEDRYHRIERSVAEINTSLSHKSDLLTETSSRLLNLENEQAKMKLTNSEIEEKLAEQKFEQSKINCHLKSELAKVESCSSIIKNKYDRVENAVSEISQSVDKKVKQVKEQISDEIKLQSQRVDELHDRYEELSFQISSTQRLEEISLVSPVEEWNNRNDNGSCSDNDVVLDKFQCTERRNRSVSYSESFPWHGDEARKGKVVSHENKMRSHVRFNETIDVDSHENSNVNQKCDLNGDEIPKSFSEELRMHYSSKNVSAKSDNHSDMEIFAQMMNRIISKTNNAQLPVFDGINADLESYKRQCLAIAKQNEWSPEDLAIRIISSLQGDARSLMTLLPVGQENQLDQIWNILKSRFDKPFSSEVAKNMLANLQQRRGETFLHLSLQVEKLVDRAYPLANLPMRQQLILDHFIKGIANSGVRYEIRLRKPKDVNQAKQLAEEISVIQASEKFQRLTYVNQISLKDKAKSDNEAETDSESCPKVSKKIVQSDLKQNVLKAQKQTHVSENGCDGNFKRDSVEQSCEQVNQRYESNGYNNQRNFVGYSPRVFQRNQNNYDQRNYQEQRWQPARNERGGYGYRDYSNRRNGEYVPDHRQNSYDVRRGGGVNNVPRGKKRNARWFNRENLRNLRDEAENVSAKGKRTY